MATATLTSLLTDVSLDPGSPTNLGTANAQTSETVINLQGTNCAATGHAGSVGPTTPTAISQFRGMYITVTAINRTNQHIHIWVRDLYPIRNKSVGGISCYLFGTSEALYYATGLDEGYLGDWYHFVINIDPTDRPTNDLGTAPSSNITRIGYCGNISASKGEAFLQNCYLDAIRRGGDGEGVKFTGGTSGDRLTLLNCADSDTNSYGCFRNIKGSLIVEGPIQFGDAASTFYLTDNLKTVSFTNFTVGSGASAVASDYYRIVFNDATTGISETNLTDITWNGVSRTTPFIFNASALSTGDTLNTTRSTYIFGSTITYCAQVTSISDKFVECSSIVPNGTTLIDPSFSNCDAITLTAVNDAISGGITARHNTATGIPFITTNDLAKIDNHAFDNTGGNGHAIEITSVGTYAFDANTFSGYGANASNDAAIYNNSGGLVTINIINGGDTPTYRNGAGASTVINNTVTVKVTTVDTSNTVIQNARVYLVADAGGPLPVGTVILSDLTDVNGIVQDTGFNFAGSQPVTGWARKSTLSPLYKHTAIVGSIESSGFSTTITMVSDE